MKRRNKYTVGKWVRLKFHQQAKVVLLVLLFTVCTSLVGSVGVRAVEPASASVTRVQQGFDGANRYYIGDVHYPGETSTPGSTVSTKHENGTTSSLNKLTNSDSSLPGDWSTYLMNNGHSGFSGTGNILNANTASNLKLYWTYQAGGGISVQPVEVDGRIYWGSWDGLEHATTLDGKQVWATNIGQTTDGNCDPSTVGVASTATVTSVNTGGSSTPVVFVGGGDANFYALNALNGKIIWSTSLGSSPSHFIWSSPVVYNGSVYIGVASFGDCPAVQGQLVKLNAATGAIQNTFSIVPDGCIGGGLWSSSTIDTQTGNLYIATGSPDNCWTKETLISSMIELRASDLSYLDSWHVPPSQAVIDNDFGATPTLFTATIGGVSVPMVGAVHKNGIFYAFNRNAIGSGPIWSDRVAIAGSSPELGQGSISPAAWDGSQLYLAGGNTSIGGTSCQGSVRAIDPATGNFLWEHCLYDGPVLAPLTMVPGVIVVEEGPVVVALKATTGATLFAYRDANGSIFDGASSISHGVLYVGNFDGNLYALGLYRNQKIWYTRVKGQSAKEVPPELSNKIIKLSFHDS